MTDQGAFTAAIATPADAMVLFTTASPAAAEP